MLPRNLRLITLLILLGIFSFHFINNVILIYHNNNPLESRRVSINWFSSSVVRYYSFIESKNFNSFYKTYAQLPFLPLLLYGAALAYPFLGISTASAEIMNMLYFFILLCSTYGIGRTMYNRKVGLFAAFLVSCIPGISDFSRKFFPDFPLVAMVALSLYLFLKTDNFRSLKYSVLFGISVGLGLLTKLSYPLFLGAPLICFFVFEYFTDGMRLSRKKALFHLALALGIGLLLAASFYAPNLHATIAMAKDLSFNIQYIQDKTLLQLFRDRIVLKPLFAISAIAFFTYLRRKELFLPLAVIVPIFLFSLSANYGGRYLLPILPVISIILSAEAFSFPQGKIIIVPLLTSFVIMQYFLYSYIPDKGPAFMKKDIIVPKLQPAETKNIFYGCNKLIDILMTNKSESNGDAQILFTFGGDKASYLARELCYHIVVKRFKFRVWSYYGIDLFMLKKNFKTFSAGFDDVVRKADFVIWKNGGEVGIGYDVWHGYNNLDIFRELQKAFERHKDNFEVCGRFSWPDKSEILVYKKKMKPQ